MRKRKNRFFNIAKRFNFTPFYNVCTNMKNFILLIGLSFFILQSIYAEKIIGDLDFESGNWALVGVPLHNYKKLPIQEELSTFISHDVELMKKMQSEWDLEMTFEDKCDYHYSLKFYQNRHLVRTVTLNLHCGYATYKGLSYAFDPQEFDLLKDHAKSVSWSRISFSDLQLMKQAIQKLNRTQEVYWYEDVQQYTYPGFIMFTVNKLPWNSNMDSLQLAVEEKIQQLTGSGAFYLQKYYHLVKGDLLEVRYILNCDEMLARKLSDYDSSILAWRSHLHNQERVSILAIGIDEKRYWKIMNP